MGCGVDAAGRVVRQGWASRGSLRFPTFHSCWTREERPGKPPSLRPGRFNAQDKLLSFLMVHSVGRLHRQRYTSCGGGRVATASISFKWEMNKGLPPADSASMMASVWRAQKASLRANLRYVQTA